MTRPKTKAIVIHSRGRSGGQSGALASADDHEDEEGAAERGDGHRAQEHVGQGGRGPFALMIASPRASLAVLVAIGVVALAGTGDLGEDRRGGRGRRDLLGLGLAPPLDFDRAVLRPRSPTTTRSGIPIRSASLNFTPGRWSRSSVKTSIRPQTTTLQRQLGARAPPGSGPGAESPTPDKGPAPAAR